MTNVTRYKVVTFAPVQGFIEKTRKLRDLHGASLILSHLSYRLVQEANKTVEVISPALPNLQKGMPNRILLKGEFSQKQVRDALLSAWKELLYECRTWVETKLPDDYHWGREWDNLGNHAWEIFWGSGESIELAMNDLERRKLSRGWTALNWIGESSSMTGADAIAFPGLGAENRNPNNRVWQKEKVVIEKFYSRLGCVLENLPLDAKPEGTLFATNEKISIAELAKRLVAIDSTGIAQKLNIPRLGNSFSDIYRRPENITESKKGRWTGWFMGDGDKVGDHLKKLAKKDNGDEEIKTFSDAMRKWGENFAINFSKELGRVIYAGGDDFLGVIYREENQDAVQPQEALDWLIKLPDEWKKHKQEITVSVGFVWAGHSVPQRDILQHCREAEKKAKSLGRNRVTVKIVFNSGQYIEWTAPWSYLNIFSKYKDREGGNNWNHIYTDLAQLEARGAFYIDKRTVDKKLVLAFFDIYFPGEGEKLKNPNFAKDVVGYTDNDDEENKRVEKMINWMKGLIKVGWQLCSNT
jgi:CRISPR-associated protein Cmr2